MSEKLPWDLPEACFEAPDFWVGGLDECHEFIRNLPGVEIIELGTSAGGRPILAAAWGEREPIERTSTSLCSSVAALGSEAWSVDNFYPPSFFGAKKREKPVLVFQGNIHGSEISGTVAAMNLLNLLAHGIDLRGQKHDKLLEEARKMRIVVIPHANPDGRARWEPAKHLLAVSHETAQRVTQGWLPDGSPLTWPACKQYFPIPEGGIPGAYYNDAGVNLVIDRFLDGDRQPETDALLKFFLGEMPDAVIMAHCDAGTLLSSPPGYVPEEIQGVTFRMAGAIAHEIRKRRLPIFSYPHFTTVRGMQRAFTQSDAVFHQCGATPLTIEFPARCEGNEITFEQILDVGLCVLETVITWGNELGFGPCLRKHLVDGRVVTKYGKLTDIRS